MEVDGGIRVKTKIDTEQTLDGLKKLEKEAEKTAQKIAAAGKKVSTAFTGMSAKQLETAIAKANKELEKQIALRDELETKANSVQDSYKPMYADATSEKQRENIDEIAQAELAPINAKWDELNAKIKESRANINAMKSALDRTKKAEDETTKSAKKKGKAEKDAAKSAKEAAKSAKQGKKTFNDWLKTALKLSVSMFGIRSAYMVLRRAASAYLDQNEELKNQIDSIWNIIGTAIGPVIEQVVGWLTVAITRMNEFVKSLTGVDLIAKSNAAALKKQADATKKASDAAKTLAGFDEINKLSDSDTSGSSGSAVTPGVFQPADTSGTPFDTKVITEKIDELQPILSGAALVLGAILLCTGAGIPLGLGLIALGAKGLADELLEGESGTKGTTDDINALTELLADASLVLGVILLCTGAAIPLGLGLIAAGAALKAAEAEMNQGKITGECQQEVESLEEIAGGCLIAIGLVLLCTGGGIPLGLGLIAAGAALLASPMQKNFETMDETEKKVNELQLVFAGALLVLGIVLACTGVAAPLGIALIVAGAANLVAAANPTKGLDEETKKKVQKLAAIVGGALIVLGMILALTGVATPLGLGLIAAGGVALATAVTPNWGSLWQKITEMLRKLGEKWSKFWKGIGDGAKGMVNSVIGFIEGMINKIISGLNWMIDQVNKIGFDVPDWVPAIGGKRFGFNLKHVAEVKLPRLAQGGIVNNPGRGVPVLAGEAGSEAILPLTKNTEWMDMLADRLGRSSDGGNIVVQIMLNGKKIQEELIKLNRKRDFATNGGI